MLLHAYLIVLSEISKYLPNSTTSPAMVFLDQQERLKVPLYEFIQEKNIIYTGGYVKCLTWSPPYADEEGITLSFVPTYLAVASYPNTGVRIDLSHPVTAGFGLIQIWSCTNLALTSEQSQPQLKPHFFLAHDWGFVMDLQWLPVPVQCANNCSSGEETSCPLAYPSLEASQKQASQLISALAGHLIAACTDGFVRVFPIPATDNRPNMPPEFKIVLPTQISADRVPENVYRFKPKTVFRLAPSYDIPPWLGWPNTFAIRSEFPHRLMVAYTSGHLAFYNLSELSTHFAKLDNRLLRPIILTHLIPGPFTSIALHPLYESIVAGLGLDRDINIWDFEDPACIEAGLPELTWPTTHMGWGGCVVWPRPGDCLWVGREEYVFSFTHNSARGGAVSLVGLKKPSDVPPRMRAYTACFPIVSPVECSRYCLEKGFEATTCLDYSESLAFLAQGDTNGEIRFHSWVPKPRRVMREKTRIAIQKNHRTYQWIMRKRKHQCPKGENGEDQPLPPSAVDITDELNFLELNALEEPFEEQIRQNCELCGEGGQTLCWHKVNEFFEFVFREGVGLQKSKFDFINSTFSSISKLATSPNPASASWIAVGTGFGIVQLICHEQFYHSSMDVTLGRPPLPDGPRKGGFYTSTQNDTTSSSGGDSDSRADDSEATIPLREERLS
uniref:WD_REPEATS_REGION domain-containing protein n=1 Tax=Mesocestoides corti TaxID=53468 RepID=A0A5K3EY59_MESCO